MKKYIIILISLLSLSLLNAQNRHKIDIDMAALDSQLSVLENDLANLDIDLSIISDNTNELLALQQTKSRKKTVSEVENKDIFDQLTDINGVEVVYISKAMLSMMPNMKMPGVNIGNTAGKLESLQILSTETKSAVINLKREINKHIKNGEYETLMYVKDQGSKTEFYTKKTQDKKNSEMIMITQDNDEVTIIRFLGNFNIKDIQSITQGR
jgi:hypothetical protein